MCRRILPYSAWFMWLAKRKDENLGIEGGGGIEGLKDIIFLAGPPCVI